MPCIFFSVNFVCNCFKENTFTFGTSAKVMTSWKKKILNQNRMRKKVPDYISTSSILYKRTTLKNIELYVCFRNKCQNSDFMKKKIDNQNWKRKKVPGYISNSSILFKRTTFKILNYSEKFEYNTANGVTLACECLLVTNVWPEVANVVLNILNLKCF